MKLVHIDLSRQVDFSLSSNYMLVIENSREFYRLSQQLYGQVNGEDGDFVLSERDILSIPNHCLFVYDYFGDFLGGRKSSNAINNKIVDILKENDFIEDFAKLNTLIIEINDKIIEKLDYNVNSLEGLEYENFVKILQYKVIKSNTLTEDLLTYIQLNTTKSLSVVIFVGLSCVLSRDELTTFLKELNYKQLYVLLIEPYKKYTLPNCETIIIDEDLCVI